MKSAQSLIAILGFSLAAAGAMAGTAAAQSATGFSSYIVKNRKELSALEKQMAKAETGSDEKAWLRWQIALNAPQAGEVTTALINLTELEASKQKLIAPDQIQITRGRALFQKGDFNEAIAAYQLVPKSSEYWFEALEEEAWAYIRLQQPDKATGKLTTLLSPVFQTWVGPESYFAANYNALKICDYPAVFKYGKQFKERHAGRLKELEILADKGTNGSAAAALPRLESGEMRFTAYAKEATGLPRFFWRDEFLRRHVGKIQDLKKQKAEPGLIVQARADIGKRLQALARTELSEYRTVIYKLHVIEAEVIQRMYLDESLKGKRPDLPKADNDPNVLRFPYTDELWLDEIDSYQARVKTCPQLKEARQ
jgi:hypothetical protein